MSTSHDDPLLKARRESALTDEVISSFQNAPNERFRFVMSSLVRHLHAFIRDVRLTEQEWETAIDFLTQVGHITDDKRQEFILLSDVLGVSMQTIGVNAPVAENATESTVFGPFYMPSSPNVGIDGNVAAGLDGVPARIFGTVTNTEGKAIPGAHLEIWEADDEGLYDVQHEGDVVAGRGQLDSDENGYYSFWSVHPIAYSIPQDGPVGYLLRQAERNPFRAPHVHFRVTAPGYHTLVTHIFPAGGDYLDRDSVFGVRESLIVDFQQRDRGAAPANAPGEGAWEEAEFNIVLIPEG